MGKLPIGDFGHLWRGDVGGGEEVLELAVFAEGGFGVVLGIEVVAAEQEDGFDELLEVGVVAGGAGWEGGFPEVDAVEVVVGGEELEVLELVGLGWGEAVAPM